MKLPVLFPALALMAGWSLTQQATAQEAMVEAPVDRVSASLSVDITTAYYFRGILQEDDGLIVQPGAEVAWDLSDAGDGSLSFAFGHWSSFHDEGTGATSTDDFIETWYEADWYAGLASQSGNWSFGLGWTNYSSPSDAFSTIDELSLSASYDDSASNGVAWNPSIMLAVELDDQGGDENAYLELGVAPSVTFELGSTPLEVSIPVTIGLSADDYYVDGSGDEDTFGYLDIGFETGDSLSDSSASGDWSWSVGVHFLKLGDGAELANNGDDSEVIVSLGLGVGF